MQPTWSILDVPAAVHQLSWSESEPQAGNCKLDLTFNSIEVFIRNMQFSSPHPPAKKKEENKKQSKCFPFLSLSLPIKSLGGKNLILNNNKGTLLIYSMNKILKGLEKNV